MALRRCALCGKYHKGGEKAHEQSCRVCGGDRQTMGAVEDVNPQYLCADKARHGEIASGFGKDSLVAVGNPPVVHRTKKPGKAQTTWLE